METIMRRGLTLIEILVVIAICVVVLGLGMMFITQQRDTARRAQCQNNLRLIGNAFHAYHANSSADERARTLPPSRLADGYATWPVLLAPHLIDQHPLTKWDLQLSYFTQTDDARQARLIMYFCPARTRTDRLSQAGDNDSTNQLFPGALGDYAAVAGDGSGDWTGPKANGALVEADVIERKDDRILRWKSRTSLGLTSLTRGDSYTFLVGEKHVVADHFGDASFGDGAFYNGQHPASFSRVAGPGFPIATIDAPVNKNFGSGHAGVCNFLLADTQVRPMTINTSEHVLGQLSRRGD